MFYICQKYNNMDKDKRAFESEEDARAELFRIINTNYNPCKQRKPCRFYRNKETGLWYLTSKIKIY